MNKKFIWLIVIIIILISAGMYFAYVVPKPQPQIDEYYGSSTYGPCRVNNDCFVSGCNLEICQSKTEEPLLSICILPDKPIPSQLNYQCQCVTQRCQWAK